ncbi:MAG: hypothetical protein L0Y58_20340 [Verrucomicrobia subdivision 3 bacterium]|nr:hypothetical protein [Limisphaerales bacterium]
MEALSCSGIRTVLFMKPPTRGELANFPGLRAFGIAGCSRTMSPAEMDRALPEAFRSLRRSGAPIVHYKICSTFDSSPQIGSIGHAIDLGRRIFKSKIIPLVVGAPPLGRYCVFGHLFARSGLDSQPFRLDRHPTMSRHPITPMRESDLRLHLAEQTACPIELVDVLKLETGAVLLETPATGICKVLLFDVLYQRHLPVIGRLVCHLARRNPPLFVVGSSGLEYALAAHWRTGPRPKFSVAPARQILAVSGSCSPVTQRQIEYALAKGFVGIPVHPANLLNPRSRDAEIRRRVAEALNRLDAGHSVVLHTSLGPEDSRITATRRALSHAGLSRDDQRLKAGRMIGPFLGRILGEILGAKKIRRIIVAGGDTSWFVAKELGINALEMIAPMAPGSPLCRAHASNPTANRLEIVFKGGQVGRSDFFDSVTQ